MPLVSVVIPTHNRAELLDTALRSVFSQTYRDFEVIVVDDGSIDHTYDVVARYGDRVRYIYQESQGPSRARNAGILASSGSYVAFLDDDDIWYPRKLELQATVLEERLDVDVVYGAAYLVRGTARRFLFAEAPDSEVLLERLIASTWTIPAGASVVMVRMAALQRSGLFDPAVYPYEDWELWARIALCGGRFAHVRTPMAEYRMHESNAVDCRQPMLTGYIAVLERVLASPKCPPAIKARRNHYLSRRWIRVGNERYLGLEIDEAWSAWREALRLDPAVLSPQLAFLMAKSLLGARLLEWARKRKRALVGVESSSL